jgi:HEAT repeat protein
MPSITQFPAILGRFAVVAAPFLLPSASLAVEPPLEAPAPTLAPDHAEVARLIQQLASKDKVSAQAAARTLGKIGPAALPQLAAAVKKQPGLIPQVGDALAEMGADAVPGLLGAVRSDKDERLRQAVARGLGGLGPAAATALVAAAKDDDVYVRLTALEALDHLTAQPDLPVPQRLVAALIESLADKSPAHRQLAAQSLARLGPKSGESVAALLRALKEDEDARVRRTAAAGLMTVIRRGHCTEAIVDGLAAATTADDEASVRAATAAAIGFVDQQKDKATDALAAALKDRYGTVRQAAAQALLQLGEDAKGALAPLIVALGSDTYPRVAWYAAGALGAIGPPAADAVPALEKALGNKDGSVRATAAEALGRIGPAASKAAPSLLAALRDKAPLVRETAARSLVAIGAPGEELSPALTGLLEDESPRVRSVAKELLGKIAMKKPPEKKPLEKKPLEKKPLVKKPLEKRP